MPKASDIRATKRSTTHPGAYLKAEYLEPMGLSATAFAAEINVPANRLTEIARPVQGCTGGTTCQDRRLIPTSPSRGGNFAA